MQATQYLKAPASFPTGPIVAASGQDRFLKQMVIAAVCELVLGSAGDDELGLKRISGKTADLAGVLDELLMVSMWSPRQVVLVDDADEFVTRCRSGLEQYLERPAKKSVLLLDVKTWPATTRLAKKTAAIGLPVDCSTLKPAEAVTYLGELCRQRHDKKIDRQAAQILVELAGTDLGLLDQELAKLAAFVGTQPGIDASAVKTLVGGWKAETTWKMLDEVRAGRLAEALQLLDKLLHANEPPLKLMGGINHSFRPLALATELSRQGTPLPAALAEAGVKYQVNEAVACLRRIGRARAERIFQSLLRADLDLKGGSVLPERLLMERLIVHLSGRM